MNSISFVRSGTGNAFAVESVTVFDLYQGKGLPEGRKSLAFSLEFSSAEKTLTDEETNEVIKNIINNLEKNLGATLRV
jgi:phenylalanyl-tRNA synthetase beta chain